MRGGQEVKISKRAGSYVTLRDLIEWTSRDAVRFFLVSRKADTEFVFDVDLALAQRREPGLLRAVRACADLLGARLDKGGDAHAAGRPVAAWCADRGRADAASWPTTPRMLARAAAELAPHDVAFYLRDLAAAFHSYYAAERFLVDDLALARARLALLAATAPGACATGWRCSA